MQELEKKLNYTFRNQELLREALNHSSYANEHRSQGLGSNERLEFLGDSVLGFVTAEYLFARHPDLPEGDLTRIRAALVCEQSLHEVAQKLNLGSYLKLGKGEEAGGGRKRPSIQADAVEAVLAGVEALRGRCIHLVIVTNDIFSDGITYDEVTALYQERLGEINRRIAAEADQAAEVVCGIPLQLKNKGQNL